MCDMLAAWRREKICFLLYRVRFRTYSGISSEPKRRRTRERKEKCGGLGPYGFQRSTALKQANGLRGEKNDPNTIHVMQCCKTDYIQRVGNLAFIKRAIYTDTQRSIHVRIHTYIIYTCNCNTFWHMICICRRTSSPSNELNTKRRNNRAVGARCSITPDNKRYLPLDRIKQCSMSHFDWYIYSWRHRSCTCSWPS